jgi:2-dehydro-3-deoxyglucarate aldolase/4-hydroxy-2-oxoheptanedioate aldolase
MITIVQIEHIDAVNNLDSILAVPGLTAVLVGSNDLSGSMGLMGQPRHPEVLKAIDTVIARSRKAGIFVGIAIGEDPVILNEWIDKGMQWFSMGNDFTLLLRAASQVAGAVREHAQKTARTAQR